MPDADRQDLDSHARYVPGYHFVLGALLTLFTIRAIVQFVKAPGPSVFGLILAASLWLLFWYARAFALTVQDRVIRLEERLRLQELLPVDLRGRIHELSPGQLVALRFASDGELPGLVRRVLDERIGDPKAIKALVTAWRADHLRV